MSTTFSVPDVPSQLTKFSPADSAIAELSKEYLPLTISGLDDVEGYNRVHEARMDIKGKRVAVEKTRKELKADALDYGRKVDAEAKRLTALLEPIEQHLLTQEKAVDDEKERIKNAARFKAEAEEQAKREAEEATRKAAQEAEDARLRAEQEKLNAERRAMEEEKARVAAEQKAAQDKIDADRRAIEMEKAKAEAAERARVETEARIAREAAAKEAAEKARAATEKAKAEAEEAARLRAEASRPTVTKLRDLANTVASVPHPELPEAIDLRVRKILNRAAEEIRGIAMELG